MIFPKKIHYFKEQSTRGQQRSKMMVLTSKEEADNGVRKSSKPENCKHFRSQLGKPKKLIKEDRVLRDPEWRDLQENKEGPGGGGG